MKYHSPLNGVLFFLFDKFSEYMNRNALILQQIWILADFPPKF